MLEHLSPSKGGWCAKLPLFLLSKSVVISRNFTPLLTVWYVRLYMLHVCMRMCLNPIVRISKFKQFVFILWSLTVAYGNIMWQWVLVTAFQISSQMYCHSLTSLNKDFIELLERNLICQTKRFSEFILIYYNC